MLELDSTAVVTPASARVTAPGRRDRSAVVLGVLGGVVGFAGSWIPSYWGDEAASVLSAGRSWSSLGALLSDIDGVHGVYYALLHIWVRIFGTSELATRAPSAIAVGFLVAGTVVVARELAGPRLAIVAGIVCIVLPRTTYMAMEARSYALGAAIAVWATVLLIRLTRRSARPLAWLAYSVVIAASMYVFLYLGLLLVVHAAFVVLLRRRMLVSWACAAGGALLLALPIIVVGYLQREQIDFLSRRHYATVHNVLVKQWFGSALAAAVAWALIAAAVVWLIAVMIRRDAVGVAGRRDLTVLGLLWLVLPTAFLLVGNALVAPMYSVRYLSFCVPAAAILIAVGARAVGSLFAPRARAMVQIGLIVVVVIACLPPYVGQRTMWAKDGGSDWRVVAAYVAQNAQTGDAVVFDQTVKPSRDPRIILDLYPEAFAGLKDVALKTSYVDRSWLWDEVKPNAAVVSRIPTSTDVWAVEVVSAQSVPSDVAMLEQRGYEIETAHRVNRTTVYHLIKESP